MLRQGTGTALHLTPLLRNVMLPASILHGQQQGDELVLQLLLVFQFVPERELGDQRFAQSRNQRFHLAEQFGQLTGRELLQL